MRRKPRTRLACWLAQHTQEQTESRLGVRNALGREGEARVASELVRRGFTILARNFRVQGIEIDLFCRKGRRFLILEVKTGRVPSRPEENLSIAQKRRLYRAKAIMAAELYIKNSRLLLRLAAVQVGLGSAGDICFFRIPLEPEADA